MDYARVILALIAVFAMIGACAYAARKFGLAQPALRATRRRRLHVVESLFLDPRRRAVILKCDGREHLVLLGPAGETVVEHCLPDALEEPRAPEPPTFADAWRRLAKRGADATISDAA